jgi:hypothetical protein
VLVAWEEGALPSRTLPTVYIWRPMLVRVARTNTHTLPFTSHIRIEEAPQGQHSIARRGAMEAPKVGAASKTFLMLCMVGENGGVKR